MISSIYTMSTIIYKVGERKGKTKSQINKITNARLKKSKKGKTKSK